jgi:hypothetical protein
MSWSSPKPTDATDAKADRILRIAAVVFAVGFVLHNADHFRRGTDAVTSEVLWAGTLSGIGAVVAVILVLSGNRWGPLAATLIGFSMAIGVSAVHLAPHWSAFSDSLPDEGLGVFTWVAVLAEIVGAAVFGAAGLKALRQRSRVMPRPPTQARRRPERAPTRLELP